MKLRVFVILLLALAVTIRLYTTFHEIKQVMFPTYKDNKAIILIYTQLFGMQKWTNVAELAEGSLSRTTSKCPHAECIFTYNKLYISSAKIVVFHDRDMPSTKVLYNLSKDTRYPHQLWAYYNMESPLVSRFAPNISHMFDITVSYHSDSDIFTPYAKVVKLNPNDQRPSADINYAFNKTKMAAWIVSNCDVAYRNRLVRDLISFGVQVSVGGNCSSNFDDQLNCTGRDCSAGLRDYKFYFAFENAFCKDYLTFKYFRNGLQYDMIPIVAGGANYSNNKISVPGSYISVADFKSVKELASHLKEIASDDKLFNSYFAWRQNYRIDIYDWMGDLACGLCKMTKSSSMNSKRKRLKDIYDKSKCVGRDEGFREILGL